MEQFNLDKWLQNKSRKVVTRDGHNVRILCTDQRGNMPIVALVEFETLDGVQIFYSNGKNESHREYDLFFADEEEILTEFEKLMIQFSHERDSLIKYGNDSSVNRCTHRYSNQLLDLARKEIEKDNVIIDKDKYLKICDQYYNNGKKEALKDLPKYKKAQKDEVLDWVVKFDKNDNIILSDVVYKGEYFITLQSLKILPKESEQ